MEDRVALLLLVWVASALAVAMLCSRNRSRLWFIIKDAAPSHYSPTKPSSESIYLPLFTEESVALRAPLCHMLQ
ncbi:hypothetical protein CHARACLAT_006988 [Characodon lateralis]|uniref:Secreted protein n=1 Tax=Characodon lateralis TaxID=208331 RepID=A0ABU7F3D5_9TELE|nr:hypothetical protein [Characodon lateralis]